MRGENLKMQMDDKAKWTSAWGIRLSDGSKMGIKSKSLELEIPITIHMNGEALKVRFDNRYGEKPLLLKAQILYDGIAYTLTLNRTEIISIPANSFLWSDPVNIDIKKETCAVIRLQVQTGTKISTLSMRNLVTQDAPKTTGEWSVSDDAPADMDEYMSVLIYGISKVQVLTKDNPDVMLAFGDSITATCSWTIPFEEKLVQTGRSVTLINDGISGNRILQGPLFDLIGSAFGEAGLERFHEAFEDDEISSVVILEGINDIYIPSMYDMPEKTPDANDVIKGLEKLIAYAQERNVKTYVGTLMPCGANPVWNEDIDEKRKKINQWIRTSCKADEIIDFDKVVRNPEDHTKLVDSYHSGDGLHPNLDGGYAMVSIISVEGMFRQRFYE